jgi:hypothetical protein
MGYYTRRPSPRLSLTRIRRGEILFRGAGVMGVHGPPNVSLGLTEPPNLCPIGGKTGKFSISVGRLTLGQPLGQPGVGCLQEW